MMEKPENFDAHEYAGISEMPEKRLENVSADILEREKLVLGEKANKENKLNNIRLAVCGAAVLAMFSGEAAKVLDSFEPSLNNSLDIFDYIGVHPLVAMASMNLDMVLGGVRVSRLESKMEEVNKKLKIAKSKVSFSHGAE